MSSRIFLSNNRVTNSGIADIFDYQAKISLNVFDTSTSSVSGAYNVKQDGTLH